MKNFILLLFMVSVLIPWNTSSIIVANDVHAVSYISDLDVALELSKETDKKILVILSASWCGYCDQLKTDLPSITASDNKLICILDIDANKNLVRKFRTKTLPTSIILNSSGQEISRISGYQKKTYSDWLNE